MFEMGEAEIAAVARVISSGRLFRFSGTPENPSESALFEKEYAEKMGVPHALAVSTGTAALICALVGLEVGPGDEVIVPGYTFFATALAPLAVGAVPVLAEVDAALMLDPADVAKKITSRTKAIIPVHMNGHLADLEPILKIARERGVKVLEDACQCVGGSYRGLRAGRHGHAGAYSFNFFKNITSGEGGCVVTSDKHTYYRARVYHDGGSAFRPDMKDIPVPVFSGVNYRTDEVRSAIMRVQLQRLDAILGALRKNCSQLREQLSAERAIEFAPVHDANGDCCTSLFLKVSSRREAQAFANAAQPKRLSVSLPFDSGRHVYINWDPLLERRGAHHPAADPLHTTEAGRAQKYSKDMLPRTLEHLERTVSIGISPRWTEIQIRDMAREIAACATAAKKEASSPALAGV